jgi:STE24 endopeptidase
MPPAALPALAVALYVVWLSLLHEAGGLPLAFYSGFVLERRYSLSNEGAAGWLKQQAKAFAIGLVFAAGGLVLLYAAIARWPDGWWLPAGAGFALVMVVLANLGPILLLPLFYRVTPLERPALDERLRALAGRAGVPPIRAFRWALGERTRKANAALTGLGASRRVLLSDTLLEEYSDEEIEVIIAHELAHLAHRDVWRGLAFETVLALGGFYAAARLLRWVGPLADLRGPADVAGLPVLLLAAGAVSLCLVPLANALSRRQERRADRFALAMTRHPAAFIQAMRRLAAQNLAESRPSRLVTWLFYTHPPIEERVAMAERWGGE